MIKFEILEREFMFGVLGEIVLCNWGIKDLSLKSGEFSILVSKFGRNFRLICGGGGFGGELRKIFNMKFGGI